MQIHRLPLAQIASLIRSFGWACAGTTKMLLKRTGLRQRDPGDNLN